jgi:hypothetical protein
MTYKPADLNVLFLSIDDNRKHISYYVKKEWKIEDPLVATLFSFGSIAQYYC